MHQVHSLKIVIHHELLGERNVGFVRLKGSPKDCAIEQQVCCLLYQIGVEQVDLKELVLLLMEAIKWTEINLVIIKIAKINKYLSCMCFVSIIFFNVCIYVILIKKNINLSFFN
jgi:hypothetical protein